MSGELYTSGEYLGRHPTWHLEDSAWKARHVLAMLRRHGLDPRTVCDVGCGAGAVLQQLQQTLDGSCEFQGYEISPQAFCLCQPRANERLHFHQADFLQEPGPVFDLLLLLDVIEHVEDCFAFLRKVQPRARYKVLHIPLDLCAWTVVHPAKLTALRDRMGHLHYFSRETALRTLADNGYGIVDHFLTAGALEATSKPWRTHVANVPRRALAAVNKNLAARLLGGFSLMVLAT